MKFKLKIPAAILLFVVLYLLMLGVRPLFSPDEARYVEIPREMLADHDYVTPRLNGVRYFEKPVMGYWMIAGAMKLFGQNNFAARLAPALSTGLAALIVVLLATKLTGRREQGWYAASCYLLMPLVFIVGTICSMDAMFSLFVTATVASFYFAAENYREKQKRACCILWLIATGAAAGCAFLVKGFLAFALPVMAVLPWLIWEKRWKEIFILPWLPFVVALAVIAPWAILIHRAQPDYWRYFVVEEHISRFFGGEEAEHPHGPFFFVLTLLWGAAEWFLLSPAIVPGFKKIGIKGESLSWFRFLICWFAGPFLLLSASSGKLPPYILPCFPPLAIMVTAALFRYFEDHSDGKGKLFNVPLMIFSGVAAVAVPVILALICFGFPESLGGSIYEKNETWKLFVVFNVAILALFGAAAAFTEKVPARKLSYFLVAAAPFFLASFFIIPQSIYNIRCMGKFLDECRDEITPDTIIIARGSNFHAVCCTYCRNDVYIVFPGELTYGLDFPDDKHRNQPYTRLQKLLDANPGKKVVMFFPAKYYFRPKLRNAFPPALSIRKSLESDPESKDAVGQVMVRFQ